MKAKEKTYCFICNKPVDKRYAVETHDPSVGVKALYLARYAHQNCWRYEP